MPTTSFSCPATTASTASQRDQVRLDRDLAPLVAHTDTSVSVISQLIGCKRLFFNDQAEKTSQA
jgi:hypothetical protein